MKPKRNPIQPVLAMLALAASICAHADDDTAPPKGKVTAAPRPAESDPKAMTAPAVETTAPDESDVHFSMGVPVWASAISGTMGVKGLAGHVDIPFNALFDHLDAIAPLSADLQVSKWDVHVDGQYAKLKETFNPDNFLVNSGTLRMQQAFANASLGYRVIDTSIITVSPFIGTRFNYVSLHGTLTSNRPKLLADQDESGDAAWADPLLGVSTSFRIAKPLTFIFHGDVGGFGAASHLTGQVYGGPELQIARYFHMDLGYRYIYTDYTSGGFTYKVDMNGPQLIFGLNF